jgi:hypothetical protein
MVDGACQLNGNISEINVIMHIVTLLVNGLNGALKSLFSFSLSVVFYSFIHVSNTGVENHYIGPKNIAILYQHNLNIT